MLEKAFERKLKTAISEVGGYSVKYFGCGYSTAGTPDLLCCIRGNFLAVEVKGDGGSVSLLQCRKIKVICAAGGLACVVYPADYEDFCKVLQRLVENDRVTAGTICEKLWKKNCEKSYKIE